jgi:UDP-N-acetylmuramoyl-tripeptide--D-alanyl-D-alanine ligase
MMANPLWTPADTVAATRGNANAAWLAAQPASGVSIDSRTLQPNDLFVALRGPSFDGHEFVKAALEKGAACALVNRAMPGLGENASILLVDDTMAALEGLARFARARSRARIVAVTGSVGKTGTKDALRHVLSRQGLVCASAASHNNRWGVALSLSRLAADADYGVVEVGMNHAGEITPLIKLVRPHVAVITTVESVHLENFASQSAIAAAKAEIFDGVEPPGHGLGSCAVLNRDNPYFDFLAERAAARGISRIIGFGGNPHAAVRLIHCAVNSSSVGVTAEYEGTVITYRVGAAGRHWAMNSLAVLGAVAALGGNVGEAAMALGDLTPQQGRGRRHQIAIVGGTIELIDDSYNASPVSMRAAFETLGNALPGGGGRRIAVLGDMLELGSSAKQMHADLLPHLVAAGVDLVFTAGTLMAALDEALPPMMRAGHEDQSRALTDQVLAALRPGDVVLIKGSYASRMGAVVDALLQGSAPMGGAGRAVNG